MVRKQASKTRIKATANEDLKVAGRAKVEQSEIPKRGMHTREKCAGHAEMWLQKEGPSPPHLQGQAAGSPHLSQSPWDPFTALREKKTPLGWNHHLASSDVPSRVN